MVGESESTVNLAKPRRKMAEKFTKVMSCFACRSGSGGGKKRSRKESPANELGVKEVYQNKGLEGDVEQVETTTAPQEDPSAECETEPEFRPRLRTFSLEQNQTSLRFVDTYIRTDGLFHRMGMSVRGGNPGPNRTSYSSNSSVNIRVHAIHPGTFAHGFGLKENDVICTINNTKVEDLQSVLNELISKDSSNLQMEITREVTLQHGGELQTKSVTAVLKHHSSLVIEQAEVESGILPAADDMPTEDIVEPEDDTKLIVRLNSECRYIKFKKKWVYTEEVKRQLQLDGTKKKDKSLFKLHSYTDIRHEQDRYPVLLQHVQTKLCVGIIGGHVIMRDPPSDLHVVKSDDPCLLMLHDDQSSDDDSEASICTFESAVEEGSFVGFRAGTKVASLIQISQKKVDCEDTEQTDVQDNNQTDALEGEESAEKICEVVEEDIRECSEEDKELMEVIQFQLFKVQEDKH